MLRNRDVDQQIARRAAANAGVAFRGDAHPRTIGNRRRNPNGQRFRSRLDALAVTLHTFFLLQASFPAARRAGFRKHHVAANRSHRARAFARHASRFRDAVESAARARAAGVLPRHRDGPLHAVPRLFKRQLRARVNVGAVLRAFIGPLTSLRQHLFEQIAKRRRALGMHAAREIEAGKAKRTG